MVRDCLFHKERDRDYGAAYPEAGVCLDSINAVEGYITAPEGATGTFFDTRATVNDVLQAKDTKFDLYVLGRAHFFNVCCPTLSVHRS